MPTDWRKTDERLIRRGELILELSFVENHQNELDAMNHGKEGRPYKLTPTYIQFLTAFRILYGVPYRQLEGFTRSLHKLIPQLPSGDYSGLRKRSLTLNPDPYQALKETDEPITIAVDSTGVKVRLAGGWVERKHGKKKRYVKLHFAVDVETKEIVALEVSTDDVHDVKAFPGLLKKAEEKRRIACWLGDGAYDSGDVFEEMEERGIEAVIKPRRNSVPGLGSSARGRAVREFLELGYEGWAMEKGYGRRWAAETAFSTFKRRLGEHSLARSMDCITRELVAKVSLYNMLVNM
jgi:transposase